MDKQKLKDILNMVNQDFALKYKLQDVNRLMQGSLEGEFEPYVLPTKSDFKTPEPNGLAEKLNKKKYEERVQRAKHDFEEYVDDLHANAKSILSAIDFSLKSVEESIRSYSRDKMRVTNTNPAKLGDIFQLCKLAIALGIKIPKETIEKIYKTSMNAFKTTNNLGNQEMAGIKSVDAVAYSWDVGHLGLLMKYSKIPMTKNDYDIMKRFNDVTYGETSRTQTGFEEDRNKYVDDNSSYFGQTSKHNQAKVEQPKKQEDKIDEPTYGFLKILTDAYTWYDSENKKRVQKCIDAGKEAEDDGGYYTITDAIGRETSYSLHEIRYKGKIRWGGAAESQPGKLRSIYDLTQEKMILLKYIENNFKKGWVKEGLNKTYGFEDALIRKAYNAIELYYNDIIDKVKLKLEEMKEKQ